MPFTIFLLIACVTVLSVFAIERGENQRDHAQLRQTGQSIAYALERRAGESSSYLRAGAALFATVDDVPSDTFRRFIDQLRLDNNYRGTDGIGWAPRVAAEEIAGFERTSLAQVGRSIEVFPDLANDAAFVVPVTYLQPDSVRNERALGYDMYSEPVRRAAMDEAARTARPIASGRVVLKQEGEGEAAGFLIYMPVFRSGSSGRVLKGFIYSPFNAQDFLTDAVQLEGRGNIGIRLFDGQIGEDQQLAGTPPADTDRLKLVEEVSIGSRQLLLEVESARGSSLSALSMVTLLFGLLVASLLMAMARILTRQAKEDAAALDWFEEQASIRNSLTRELNHRVKNTLANVLSIVSLTRRRSDNLDDFAEALDGRIRALSATHDLLTQSEWGTTPISAVAEAELAPYIRNSEEALQLDGPAVELAPNDALSLGLALHELATNASKFGALSEPGGFVRVHWRLVTDGLARIEWTESGGPPVAEERKRGFGTELIEKIVAHELKHPVDLRFEPAGVECALLVPVRVPSEFAMRATKRFEGAGGDK
ncbi:CHASE domain-containing protein [Altererythrobacter sp. ZODW24]|uniref:CHASE domain-containing protein n=1 Tax=Altererythrobacter sp. ZODW24 TaxID=2185142 RepID=UPI000DF8047D|nr:CHASE domain-containing protein [Altererythrobacter sp. ZODW24]